MEIEPLESQTKGQSEEEKEAIPNNSDSHATSNNSTDNSEFREPDSLSQRKWSKEQIAEAWKFIDYALAQDAKQNPDRVKKEREEVERVKSIILKRYLKDREKRLSAQPIPSFSKWKQNLYRAPLEVLPNEPKQSSLSFLDISNSRLLQTDSPRSSASVLYLPTQKEQHKSPSDSSLKQTETHTKETEPEKPELENQTETHTIETESEKPEIETKHQTLIQSAEEELQDSEESLEAKEQTHSTSDELEEKSETQHSQPTQSSQWIQRKPTIDQGMDRKNSLVGNRAATRLRKLTLAAGSLPPFPQSNSHNPDLKEKAAAVKAQVWIKKLYLLC